MVTMSIPIKRPVEWKIRGFCSWFIWRGTKLTEGFLKGSFEKSMSFSSGFLLGLVFLLSKTFGEFFLGLYFVYLGCPMIHKKWSTHGTYRKNPPRTIKDPPMIFLGLKHLFCFNFFILIILQSFFVFLGKSWKNQQQQQLHLLLLLLLLLLPLVPMMRWLPRDVASGATRGTVVFGCFWGDLLRWHSYWFASYSSEFLLVFWGGFRDIIFMDFQTVSNLFSFLKTLVYLWI